MQRRSAGSLTRSLLGLCLAVGAALPGTVYATADTFVLVPDTQVVGQTSTVAARQDDTLTDIARIHGLGYEEIVWANRKVDIWLPGEGTPVVLPKSFILPGDTRQGVVVNIAEYRLYHYYKSNGQLMVSTFPISIGRMDWATPIGRWTVTSKQKDPAWYPPESIRQEHLEDGRGFLAKMVPAGPDNPLGRYAMRLSATGYLIHGTNKPVGVGMQVTHGCIRMYPEDVEELFGLVSINTQVNLIDQTTKVGWQRGTLYVERHAPLEGTDNPGHSDPAEMTDLINSAVSGRNVEIDWAGAERAFQQATGVPVPLSRPARRVSVVEQRPR
jgi:L,D-transpeptidase ErfK/SrfK